MGVEPAAAFFLEEALFGEGDIVAVLRELGVEGNGVVGGLEDLEVFEDRLLAKSLDALFVILGGAGFYDVVDVPQGVGAVAGAHERFGSGGRRPVVIGSAAGCVLFFAMARAFHD